jgi:hypothetical protein
VAGFTYKQTVLSDEWMAVHNLGTKYVNLEVIVEYNNHYETILPASVISVDENTLQINFSRPFTGEVRINN